VLAAAGHRVPKRPRELPAGLTERELEVLLVLVRGESNQEIAQVEETRRSLADSGV
jgi:DNA-binding NarL/FixJ family response regulator